MKNNFFLIFLFSYMLYACDSNKKSMSSEMATHTNDSNMFAVFLKNRFSVKPIKDNSYYIVIPDNGCNSCSMESLLYIGTKKQCKNVFLVVSNTIRKIPESDVKKIKKVVGFTYADTTYQGKNELDRLDLPFNSFTGIVYFANGQVSYKSFDVNNYREIISGVFCKDTSGM